VKERSEIKAEKTYGKILYLFDLSLQTNDSMLFGTFCDSTLTRLENFLDN